MSSLKLPGDQSELFLPLRAQFAGQPADNVQCGCRDSASGPSVLNPVDRQTTRCRSGKCLDCRNLGTQDVNPFLISVDQTQCLLDQLCIG